MTPDEVALLQLELLKRIVAALERIADDLDAAEERESYDSALARWRAGSGRHPDD